LDTESTHLITECTQTISTTQGIFLIVAQLTVQQTSLPYSNWRCHPFCSSKFCSGLC